MAVGRGYLAMYVLRDGSNATRNTRCSNGTEIDCTIRSLLKNIGRSKGNKAMNLRNVYTRDGRRFRQKCV